MRDAVEAMPSRPALDADYTSLWPSGTEVRDVQVDGDLATVDLSARAAEGSAGAAFEEASGQQLVHTVTAAEPSVVAAGFSTATDGAPGRGEWSAPVDVPPGDYVLRAFSESAEDGSELFLETRRVAVTE